MVRVFGIRHHGPGSAARLRRALQSWRPDAVLLELPEDLTPALARAGHADLEPPVALLGYDPKQPRRAAYLPFADFSPEWQAIRFALDQGIALRAIDLPLGRLFQLQEQERQNPELALAPPADPEARRLRHDPLSYLARLAGYRDSERWWEVYFEQGAGPDQTFDLILETMGTLREELGRDETRETLAREAYMRKQLRRAQAEAFERVAVVCGAWHAPVLQAIERFRVADDNRALRGLRARKTAATWIPWSYDRLARQGGYRAGVASPAWYELLFADRRQATVRWMSRAGQLLRGEGLDSSPAQATEAVRLAETLAQLRRLAVPGLDELLDAALAVFAQGDPGRLGLIRQRLVVGERLGSVPADTPAVPLQRDLDRCVRSARLTRERKATRRLTRELDLRKPANRLASQLLHRLRLLGIPWGERHPEAGEQLGSFRETWTLRWRPEFHIRVIEQGMLGNTVRDAAARALLQRAEDARELPELTDAAEAALQADLPELFDQLLLLTRNRAAISQDVEPLMRMLPPLVRIQRYGDTRQTDTEAVGQLIGEILPRIAIGLPGAATGRQDEAAQSLFEAVLDVHHAMGLLDDPALFPTWVRSLEQLAERKGIHPLLGGSASRILFDLEARPASWTGDRLNLALSRGEDAMRSTRWLEGFLHGGGLLLLHHPALWRLLDDWVARLDLRQLPALLPLLRRAFAQFSPGERRRLMDLARQGPESPASTTEPPLDDARAARTHTVIDQLLGDREATDAGRSEGKIGE